MKNVKKMPFCPILEEKFSPFSPSESATEYAKQMHKIWTVFLSKDH